MRPIRLTIQAFGPFAGREVVDFRDATSAGLFGVYGPTGAGKSTIFSAMTFALFGEAAKAEQEASSLRSDYSAPNVVTEVELVFDVAGRRYVVRRRPEQIRPKQKGVGTTKVPHEASLFDATGLALDAIGPDQAGKVIAEKKATLVRDAVEELLGYGADQFRQIVLLPQGRFETFLIAKTDARLDILRELFDVSLYRNLAARLKDDADGIEREVRHKRELCAGRLRAENFESGEALEQGIGAIEALHTEKCTAEAGAIGKAKTTGEAFAAAEQIEQKFLLTERTQKELVALVGRENDVQAIEHRNSRTRRAETIIDAEHHLLEAERQFVGATTRRVEVVKAATDAQTAGERAAAKLLEERSRDGERDALRQKIQVLELNKVALEGSRELAESVIKAKSELAKAAKDFKSAEDGLKRSEKLRLTAEQDLELVRKNRLLRTTLSATLANLKAEHSTAQVYERSEKDLTGARGKATKASAVLETATEAARQAEVRYREAETRLAEVQALHLAAKLGPGEPCPVCGSVEHPKLATGKVEHQGLDEAFRKAKSSFDVASKNLQEAAGIFNSAEAERKVREGAFSDLPPPTRLASEVRAALDAVTNEIVQLGEERAVADAEEHLNQSRKRCEEATTLLQGSRTVRDLATTAEAQASARLAQALEAIPEPLREPKALDSAMQGARKTLAASDTALQLAVKNEQTTREAALIAAKGAEGSDKEVATAKERRDQASTHFGQRLAENELTKEEFPALKLAVATVAESEAQVVEYRRQLNVARANDEVARKAIDDILRPDLTSLGQARDEAVALAQAATNERAQVSAKLDQLRKLLTEVADELKALTKLEEDSNSLRGLAALFNANNEQRLDLETFAIGAMFDQVIEAANQRLGPMTASRYTLEREADITGGRSRQGLGIRVSDVFTGKSRPTSTLSGGESFVAALALALGLSDIVERTSGRVRLDTVFIDEGFGSLDAEDEAGTLDQVLQVLTNLVSQHRSVGIISHIGLVQECIPNGFYIRKGQHGSHVEARGPA